MCQSTYSRVQTTLSVMSDDKRNIFLTYSIDSPLWASACFSFEFYCYSFVMVKPLFLYECIFSIVICFYCLFFYWCLWYLIFFYWWYCMVCSRLHNISIAIILWQEIKFNFWWTIFHYFTQHIYIKPKFIRCC
jgi:hypothetical protein